MRTRATLAVLGVCFVVLAVILIVRPARRTAPDSTSRTDRTTSAAHHDRSAAPSPSASSAALDAATSATSAQSLFAADQASTVPLWVARLAPPRPGPHTYCFYVDARQMADPEAPDQTGKDLYGDPLTRFGYPLVGQSRPRKDPADGKLVFAWRGRLDWPAVLVASYTDGPWDAVEFEPANAAARENVADWDRDDSLAVVSGTVVDPDGRPAPYARAVVMAFDSSSASRDRIPVRATRANAQGRFRMDHVPVEQLVWTCCFARAPGFAYGWVNLDDNSRSKLLDLKIQLTKAAVVTGRVLDGSGRGVPGAEVYGGEAFASETTDATGAFRLDYLPAEDKTWLRARARGFVPGRTGPLDLKTHENLEGVHIVLRQGVALAGRVVQDTPDGDRPAEGVRVSAYAKFRDVEFGERSFVTNGVDSDADGGFVLEGVPTTGTLTVYAVKGYLRTEDKVVEIAGGVASENLTLRLAASLPVRGVVRDAQGQGVADAEIRAWATSSAEFSEKIPEYVHSRVGRPVVRADRDGRFVVEDLSAKQTYSIIADAKGYARGSVSHVIPVELYEDVTITLTRGGRIAGKVLVRDGRTPVAGAEVILDSTKDKKTRTSTDGSFVFEGLSEGGFLLAARIEEFPGGGKGVTLANRDSISLSRGETREDIELLMVRASRIAGRVIERDSGAPVPKAMVHTYDEAYHSEQTVTDAEGRFAIDGVAPGKVSVSVYKNPLIAEKGLGDQKIELREGENREGMVLKMIRGTGTISGVVLDASGVASANIHVSVVGDDSDSSWSYSPHIPSRGAESDKQGKFRLENLPLDRSYRVTARNDEWVEIASSASVRLTGEKPEATVGLRLRSRIVVLGRVLDDAGAALENASVLLTRDVPEADVPPRRYGGGDENHYRAETDAKGEWTVEVLTSGTFSVQAERTGYISLGAKQVEVRESPTDTGDLTLRKGLVLRGLVSDLAGKPLVGWTISGGSVAAASSYTGTFTLDGVESSTTLRFSNSGSHGPEHLRMAFESDSFAVPEEEMLFVLPVVARVHGRFVSAETGDPVGGVEWKLEESDSTRAPGTGEPKIRLESMYGDSHADRTTGVFTLAHAPIGTFVIQSDGAGTISSEYPVEILPDHTDLGDIPVKNGARISTRFVDADGKPFKPDQDTSVNLRITRDGKRDTDFFAYEDVDSDGRATFRGVPLDTEKLSFDNKEFVAVEVEDLPELEAGKTADLGDIVIARGATLLGRVVDAVSGKPVRIRKELRYMNLRLLFADGKKPVDASVENLGLGKPPDSPKTGRFRVRAVESGAKEMRFYASDGVFHTLANPSYAATGETDLGDIPFPSHRRLRGRIVASGLDVDDRMVAVSALWADGSVAMAETASTEKDGVFAAGFVPDGVSEVMVWCQGFRPTVVALPAPGDKGIDLGTISPERGQTVRCRAVRQGSGEALKGGMLAQCPGVPFPFARFGDYGDAPPKGVIAGQYVQMSETSPDDRSAQIVGGLYEGPVRLLFYPAPQQTSWWRQEPVAMDAELKPGAEQEIVIEVPSP